MAILSQRGVDMVSAPAVLGFFLRCGYGELEQHLSKTLCALNMSSKIRPLPWIFSESLNEYASSKECTLPHCATSLLGAAGAADHPTQEFGEFTFLVCGHRGDVIFRGGV